DGIDGLRTFEQERPFDLCLLDVRMPRMAGDELARHVHRTDPNCKVLYFTGFSDALFDSKVTLRENEAFLDKPATPSALVQAVSVLLFGHTHGLTPTPSS